MRVLYYSLNSDRADVGRKYIKKQTIELKGLHVAQNNNHLQNSLGCIPQKYTSAILGKLFHKNVIKFQRGIKFCITFGNTKKESGAAVTVTTTVSDVIRQQSTKIVLFFHFLVSFQYIGIYYFTCVYSCVCVPVYIPSPY